jgi:DNA polymerase-3 subunit epsilon
MVLPAPDTVRHPVDVDRFAVVDVETSGLSRGRHRILQVAVVTTTADGTVLERWSSYVRPRFGRFGRVGPSHIHGLTARSLRTAPPFANVAPDLVSRLDGAVFVAHNAAFDWGFVKRSLRRAGYRPPDAARLCTMRLSRAIGPQDVSHRLVDLCERHGVAVVRAHDAQADADATAAVLPALLAHGNVTGPDDLAPHLRGTTTAWPAWSTTRWRRLTYRWSR